MSLQVQIQSLVASFFFGLLYGLCYGFYNRCVLKISFKTIKLILEIGFNLLFVTAYFYAMLWINYGKFYLYHYILLFLGVIFYLTFLAKGYLKMIETWMAFFRWLFLPFSFINKKIHDILSHIKKVKRHGNKKSKYKKSE